MRTAETEKLCPEKSVSKWVPALPSTIDNLGAIFEVAKTSEIMV